MGGTYNSKKVTVALTEKATGNSHIVTGFAEDSRVEVNENEDDVNLTKGSDGEFAWSITNDDSGVLVLHLLQTSSSNDWLSEVANRQKLIGAGELTVNVKDLKGRSLHFSPSARIARNPDASYETQAGERTWNIKLAKVESFVGGNS